MLLKKNKLGHLLIFLIFIVFISCEDTTISENENELLVVTAYLYEGQPVKNIQLTKTLSLGSEDTIATAITDATITLMKNGKSYLLENDIDEEGYYVYNGFDLNVNSYDHFKIEILFEDQVISGETEVPFKPQNMNLSKEILELEELDSGGPFGGGGFISDSNSILISWDNVDSTLYYVVIENIEENPESIYSDLPFAINRRFISLPSATREYSITRRIITHYGRHFAILYKVNQEYADLYDTSEQDSRNLNEPLSNISNGLGIFSAFASDTLSFEVIKDN